MTRFGAYFSPRSALRARVRRGGQGSGEAQPGAACCRVQVRPGATEGEGSPCLAAFGCPHRGRGHIGVPRECSRAAGDSRAWDNGRCSPP